MLGNAGDLSWMRSGWLILAGQLFNAACWGLSEVKKR
jgi:hypothetical protein